MADDPLIPPSSKNNKSKHDRATMAHLRWVARQSGIKPRVTWMGDLEYAATSQFLAERGWPAFSLREVLRAKGVLGPTKRKKKAKLKAPASALSPADVPAPSAAAEVAPRPVAESVAITPAPKPKKTKATTSDKSQLSLFDAGIEAIKQKDVS